MDVYRLASLFCLVSILSLAAVPNLAHAGNAVTVASAGPCGLLATPPGSRASDLQAEIPAEFLDYFARIQRNYYSDSEMKRWRSRDEISDREFKARVAEGKNIPGPIVGALASPAILLKELQADFPQLISLLPAVLPMKWEATAYYDIPKRFGNNRPWEVTDGPAGYADFSEVDVKRKVFEGRGLIPSAIAASPLLRLSIRLEKNLVTLESNLTITLHARATTPVDQASLNKLYETLLPQGKMTLVERASYSMPISELGPLPVANGVQELSLLFGRLKIYLDHNLRIGTN